MIKEEFDGKGGRFMTTNEKNGGYQLLSQYRSQLMGFALLLIMLFHAYNLNFGVPSLDYAKSLCYLGVDVFILLSGLGVYGSIVRNTELSFPQYFLRRCKRVLPTYWLVVGVYSLWLYLHDRIALTTGAWSLSTFHYWFNIPNSFNWYIPAILAFYLLAPLWVKLLRRCPFKLPLSVLTLALSYGLYRLAIVLDLLYLADFLFRIPAFALGLLMGCYIFEKRPLTKAHLAAWSALALCGLTAAVLYAKGRFYIHPCYMLAACIVPLCLLLAKLFSLIRWQPFHRFLSLLGESSLEIYLLNVIFTREYSYLAILFDVDSRHIVCYAVTWALNILFGVQLHRFLQRFTTKKA